MEKIVGLIMMVAITASLIIGTIETKQKGGILSAVMFIGDFFRFVILIAYVTKIL